MLKFQTFGPFVLPRQKYQSGVKKGKFRKSIDNTKKSRASFWENIDKKEPGLPDAVGCYVFALGKIPWYVGKTERWRFKNETWEPHKLNHYNAALAALKKAKPVLYLIAKRTPLGKFSKATKGSHKDIKYLEILMIGAALRRNDKLRNKRDTTYLKTIHVPGFMNSAGPGRPGNPAGNLAKVFAAK